MRKEEAGWPAKVKVGYGTAAATRGLHPRGLQERLINRLAELEGLDPKIHIIRISARVGERKRLGLLDEIRHRNFHIANPGKQEEKPVTSEEPAAEEASEAKETQTSSKPNQAKEEAEETVEPDTMENSAKPEESEDEDK
jgi:hypothetical protein